MECFQCNNRIEVGEQCTENWFEMDNGPFCIPTYRWIVFVLCIYCFESRTRKVG